MKKVIILLVIILPLFGLAQNTIPPIDWDRISIIKGGIDPSLLPVVTLNEGYKTSNEGYKVSNFRDTVAAYFLISLKKEFDDDDLMVATFVMHGYVIRFRSQYLVYPNHPYLLIKYDNDPYHMEIESYLNIKKEKIKPEVIIWQTKII